MPLDFEAAQDWQPPPEWQRLQTIDAHTAGEPFRILVGGTPEIPGASIPEKRRWAEQHADDLRRLLMLEPRGHADMYGCLLTEPVTPDADFGILFLHNEGFSTMCGHGIIAAVTVALETGMLPAASEQATVTIDAPAGLIRARAELRHGQVERVTFRNVPSFVLDLDAAVEVPGYGTVRYDLAFGGAFYAFVDAGSIDLPCDAAHSDALIQAGRAIKQAVQQSREVPHPTEPDLGFLYGVIFTGPAAEAGRHSRHVCIFADGELDRSPTGTGVSARIALCFARREIDLGQTLTIESILGSTFGCRAIEPTRFGPYEAVLVEVEGTATITGRHEFLLDPRDAFPKGFFLR